MISTWVEPEPIVVPPELGRFVGGHPLLSEILARRGILAPAHAEVFLNPARYRPASPFSMPGMEDALTRLVRALSDNEPVVVWGDFDVDGQTATAILFEVLSRLGVHVAYHIPSRSDDSRGLNLAALKEHIDAGARLILTCDCGVSDLEELEYCRQHGVDVIVTDHHDLPEADVPSTALVNPRLLSEDHPLAHLSGAGVAFKLAEALLAHYRRPDMVEELRDLAALGTIADVVPLIAENRYLVQRGLPILMRGRRLGIGTLLRIAKVGVVDPDRLDTEPVSFELAPALNSAGRLAHAELALRLLLTHDAGEAEQLALQVVQLNAERRYQTRMVEEMARDQIDKLPRPLPAVLVVSDEDWHPGVIGIVAGRLAEEFHRPAVVVSKAGDGLARGSARSVPGIDIHQAIAKQRDLLEAEGGHPMAAGFGIKEEHLPEFRHRLAAEVARLADSAPPAREPVIDAWVEWEDISLSLCDELSRLAPFGVGNRPPLLAARHLMLTGLHELQTSIRHGSSLRLRLSDTQGIENEVLWWRAERERIPGGHMDVAFTLKADVYQGRRRPQLTLVDLRRSAPAPVDIPTARRELIVHDRRSVSRPEEELQGWLARAGHREEIVCWGEGSTRGRFKGLIPRDQLAPAETLVIWTSPPGPLEFRQSLERTRARRIVVLFGDHPASDVAGFLKQLIHRITYVLRHQAGWTSLDALAGALAQRRVSVKLGLDLLMGATEFVYQSHGDAGGIDVQIIPSGQVSAKALLRAPATESLCQLFEETAAYRRYLAGAPLSELLPEPFVPASPDADGHPGSRENP